MAGYNGYSMSNNAVEAYRSGEKPKSKWSKSEIIEGLNDDVKEYAKKLTVKELRDHALYCSSWHHTSSHYNKTDFYTIDDSLTIDSINNIIANREPKQISISETWECEFLEWSGSRNHPKATKYVEIGEIKGNWFYRANGGKKSVNANGFWKIRKIEGGI